MHAFRAYLQAGLDARGWSQADFVHRSGLTRQRVSQMLNDPRDRLPAVPRAETLQAIAKAFVVGESTVTAIAFEAMGYDLNAVRREADLSTASTQDIVRALAERVGVPLAVEERDSGGDTASIGKDQEQEPAERHLRVAAKRGQSRGRAMKREADELGEESQDV